MKRILTYINATLFSFLLFTSCSQEADDEAVAQVEQHSPYVELQLAFPPSDYSPVALKAAQPYERPHFETGIEDGTTYENHILGGQALSGGMSAPMDIQVFAFDAERSGHPYLGKAEKLVFTPETPDKLATITGKLPLAAADKTVKLILLANYQSRQAAIAEPPLDTPFDTWVKAPTFPYGASLWSVTDGEKNRFLPMSGEAFIYVQHASPTLVNKGSIQLKRAIAKVRVTAGAETQINSIAVRNAQDAGYVLPQTAIRQLGHVQEYTVPGGALRAGQTVFFYLPEQPEKQTTLRLTFKGDTTPVDVEFKNYQGAKYDPNGHHTYPIERNYLYDFIITLQGGGGIDIRGNVMDWEWYDVNTNIE